MLVIYKYPIELRLDDNFIYCNLPKGAEELSCVFKDLYEGYIYAIVNKEETETIEREVLWAGTSGEINQETKKKMDKYTYLGTHLINGSNLVWHIWLQPEY